MEKETATQADLMETIALLERLHITYWLDGGWGVDVLLGRQTRAHRDIDIDFDSRRTGELLEALQGEGYVITTDWRPARIELYHPERSYIDIHPLLLAEDGTAKQADLEGGWYLFEADYFAKAAFAGKTIPCISAKGQKAFHAGYELREVDLHDIRNIERLLGQGDA